MSIGTRIKERREELGMTQTQLADKIGVSKGAIGNYETDANSPKASMMYKIFAALDCDANYLYQDESPELKSDILPDDKRYLLRLYDQLNQEGQEKMIDLADDMVQSGKYIKSSKAQLDKKEA